MKFEDLQLLDAEQIEETLRTEQANYKPCLPKRRKQQVTEDLGSGTAMNKITMDNIVIGKRKSRPIKLFDRRRASDVQDSESENEAEGVSLKRKPHLSRPA